MDDSRNEDLATFASIRVFQSVRQAEDSYTSAKSTSKAKKKYCRSLKSSSQPAPDTDKGLVDDVGGRVASLNATWKMVK